MSSPLSIRATESARMLDIYHTAITCHMAKQYLLCDVCGFLPAEYGITYMTEPVQRMVNVCSICADNPWLHAK